MSMLTSTQMASKIGVARRTLIDWYRFDEEFGVPPEMPPLPPCTIEQRGKVAVRLWEEQHAKALIKFRKAIPVGRNGFMGAYTKRYRLNNDDQNSK